MLMVIAMNNQNVVTNNKNTYCDLELNNGSIVKLTLTFGRLNLLKRVNNELYQKYNKIIMQKSDDILDLVTILYVAYWCAYYNAGQSNIYTENDFIELAPFDLSEIKRIYKQLTQPKKKMNLEEHSILNGE